jgi:hypothetical protein
MPRRVERELSSSLFGCSNLRFLAVSKKLISGAPPVDGEGQAYRNHGGGGTAQDLVPKEVRGKFVAAVEELAPVRTGPPSSATKKGKRPPPY